MVLGSIECFCMQPCSLNFISTSLDIEESKDSVEGQWLTEKQLSELPGWTELLPKLLVRM